MLGLLLVAISLGFMAFRVVSPIGTKVEGRNLASVALTYRERLSMQRLNLCALGVLLLLSAVGHWFKLPFELLAIVAAYGLLMVPVRYQVTTEGIAINRVVFRHWNEFAGIEIASQKITIVGKPSNGRFPIWLAASHQRELLPFLYRYVQGSIRPGDSPASSKGGPQQGRMPFRRLLERRS